MFLTSDLLPVFTQAESDLNELKALMHSPSAIVVSDKSSSCLSIRPSVRPSVLSQSVSDPLQFELQPVSHQNLRKMQQLCKIPDLNRNTWSMMLLLSLCKSWFWSSVV